MRANWSWRAVGLVAALTLVLAAAAPGDLTAQQQRQDKKGGKPGGGDDGGGGISGIVMTGGSVSTPAVVSASVNGKDPARLNFSTVRNQTIELNFTGSGADCLVWLTMPHFDNRGRSLLPPDDGDGLVEAQAGTSSIVLMEQDWNTLLAYPEDPVEAKITFSADVERGETFWVLRANPAYAQASAYATVYGDPTNGYWLTTTVVGLHNNWNQTGDYASCTLQMNWRIQ